VSKIAVFGGSFDPVHKAHIQIAQEALKQFDFKKLFFVLAYISPHKTKRRYAPVEDRLNMLKLAVGKLKKTEISLYEVQKKRAVYTYRTLDYFQSLYPKDEIYKIIGSDSLIKLPLWKNIDYIAKHYRFIAAKRPKINIKKNIKYIDSCRFLNSTMDDISSTKIRSSLKKNLMFAKKNLNKKVYNYIVERGLYI
jgi:nicotinate-nucleotide adenylyltransferase